MNELLDNTFNFVLSKWYYTSAFFFVFFSVLYFVGTFITEAIVQYKTKNANLRQIVFAQKPGQRAKEIKNSLLSIFVFSLQAIFFQYLFSIASNSSRILDSLLRSIRILGASSNRSYKKSGIFIQRLSLLIKKKT